MRFTQAQRKHLEDINGDDKSLATITTEMIELTEYDYVMNGNDITKKGNKSGVEEYYSGCDYSYIKSTIKKLTGIYISQTYLGSGKNVTYNINSNVESGNLRIVITDSTNKVLYDIPIDQNTTTTFNAKEGETYFVKFIGESAYITVEINIVEN